MCMRVPRCDICEWNTTTEEQEAQFVSTCKAFPAGIPFMVYSDRLEAPCAGEYKFELAHEYEGA